MTQIARTVLPLEANFHIALARVFGIGRSSALQISEACGISKDMKVGDPWLKSSHLHTVQ